MTLPDLKDRSTISVFLVLSIVIGYFGVIVLIAYANVTDARLAQVIGLVTAVQNAFMLIVGYYFGSSAGSSKKTDMLSDLAGGTGDGTSKTTANVKTEITKTTTTEPKAEETP